MSLVEGQAVELAIEKPAAGGRMIARHHGQVVLVRGAVPGERVRAWIERAEKRLAYAVTREVLEPSPDRRPAAADPLCGGALYSHIRYERQLAIKSDVIRDAFARLGRHPLQGDVPVAASPEEGYRMRARFHVHAGRAGFYREGTHQLCDAAPTRQLGDAAVDAVTALAAALERDAPRAVTSLSVTENISATERAVHIELAPGARVDPPSLERHLSAGSVRGISIRGAAAEAFNVGIPIVTDPLDALIAGDTNGALLQRRAESFFQGNRFLLRDLVSAVAVAVPDDGEVIDLYAGVGLFSVALAAAGRSDITAVEGDRSSGADLRENARPFAPRLDVRVQRVEDFLLSRRAPRRTATVIVDPPRTGLSKDAANAMVRHAPSRIVYVSCDPATLARDVRTLLDAGYRLDAVRAFDLFPNTPHVETLAVFTRAAAIP